MKNLIFIFLLLIFSSCSILVKSVVGIKSPRVETRETIAEFLTKNKITTENHFVQISPSDSVNIYTNMMKCFNNEVFLYDKDGCRYCYQGDKKCSGFQLKRLFDDFENNYQPCTSQKIVFDSIVNNLVGLSGMPIKDTLTDYYLLTYWSKFFQRKKRLKEDIQWLTSLQSESQKRITLIFINTDLQENWGLEKGKKLNLKFRMLGKHALQFEFGALPYKKEK